MQFGLYSAFGQFLVALLRSAAGGSWFIVHVTNFLEYTIEKPNKKKHSEFFSYQPLASVPPWSSLAQQGMARLSMFPLV